MPLVIAGAVESAVSEELSCFLVVDLDVEAFDGHEAPQVSFIMSLFWQFDSQREGQLGGGCVVGCRVCVGLVWGFLECGSNTVVVPSLL